MRSVVVMHDDRHILLRIIRAMYVATQCKYNYNNNNNLHVHIVAYTHAYIHMHQPVRNYIMHI